MQVMPITVMPKQAAFYDGILYNQCTPSLIVTRLKNVTFEEMSCEVTATY
jgi:hypothetical protein